MDLVPRKRPGNPKWAKGVVTNPKGRERKPKFKAGSKVAYKLKKMGVDPLERLVDLALKLEMQQKFRDAASIWETIQSYVEPKKKPVEAVADEMTAQDLSTEAEAHLKLLETLSNGPIIDIDPAASSGSDPLSLGAGKALLQIEAGPTPDLPADIGEPEPDIRGGVQPTDRQDDDDGGAGAGNGDTESPL